MPPHPESENEEYEPSPDEAVEGAYHEEVNYDPGSALVDENQYYGEVEEPAYDPQAYDAPEGSGVYDEAPPQVPPPPALASAPKKKAPARSPQRRPAVKRTTPATRRPVKKPVYDEGISVMTVFLTLIALGMLAAVTMAVLPKDMSSVGGYQINPVAGDKSRNLLAEMQKLMIERNTEITFTEEEVNRYLNHRLSGEQKGTMAALVKFRGVYVDFTPTMAEMVIERELFGMPLTTSVTVTAEEFRRQTIYKPTTWSIGRISLGARTVKPVVDLFIRLRASLLDEYHAMQQMTGVRFEDNRVVLDAKI